MGKSLDRHDQPQEWRAERKALAGRVDEAISRAAILRTETINLWARDARALRELITRVAELEAMDEFSRKTVEGLIARLGPPPQADTAGLVEAVNRIQEIAGGRATPGYNEAGRLRHIEQIAYDALANHRAASQGVGE